MFLELSSIPISSVVIGEQLMNLEWLIFYLIKIFNIKVVGTCCRLGKTLRVSLVLIFIISLLIDYYLTHTEFNSSDFKDFSTADPELVLGALGSHIVANNDPEKFLGVFIAPFQVIIVH